MAFYMLHQTVIVGLGYLTIGWSEAPLLKYLVIVAVTTATSLALAVAVATNPVTRILFGMAGRKKEKAAATDNVVAASTAVS